MLRLWGRSGRLLTAARESSSGFSWDCDVSRKQQDAYKPVPRPLLFTKPPQQRQTPSRQRQQREVAELSVFRDPESGQMKSELGPRRPLNPLLYAHRQLSSAAASEKGEGTKTPLEDEESKRRKPLEDIRVMADYIAADMLPNLMTQAIRVDLISREVELRDEVKGRTKRGMYSLIVRHAILRNLAHILYSHIAIRTGAPEIHAVNRRISIPWTAYTVGGIVGYFKLWNFTAFSRTTGFTTGKGSRIHSSGCADFVLDAQGRIRHIILLPSSQVIQTSYKSKVDNSSPSPPDEPSKDANAK